MSSCDDIQLAITMRQHTTPSVPDPVVDEHLATCDACRRYAALATNLEKAMHATTTQLTQNLDWDALRNSVANAMNRLKLAAFLAPLAVLVLTAFAIWAFPENWTFFLVVMPLSGLLIAALAARKHLSLNREASQAAQSDGDLLAFWRTHLEKTYKGLAVSGGTLGLCSLIWLLPLVTGLLGDAPIRQTAYYSVLGIYFLGYALYAFVVARPRTRAQLDALK